MTEKRGDYIYLGKPTFDALSQDWETLSGLCYDRGQKVNDLEAANAVLELKLKEARAEIVQLKALLTPQPSDLDMAIEMLSAGFSKAHAKGEFGEAYSVIMQAVDETIEELKRVRTVQNVSHNNEP